MSSLPRGIFPPLVTPFRGEVFDGEAYAANIESLNGTRLAGYVVLGSNGESVYLDEDEAVCVIETAAAARAPEKALIVGTGRESTRATIEATGRAAAAGADAALVVPPSYYRGAMTPAVLEAHYLAVAEAAEIPILLYHVPKFSPIVFQAEMVRRLSSHPGIIGMKDTSQDLVFLTSCLADCPQDFLVYVGTANILLAGLTLGAAGGVLALANIAPNECVELSDLFAKGDTTAARALQQKLLPVNQALTAGYGIPGLKYAHDLLGLVGGDTRRPLLPLCEEDKAALKEILRKGLGRP